MGSDRYFKEAILKGKQKPNFHTPNRPRPDEKRAWFVIIAAFFHCLTVLHCLSCRRQMNYCTVLTKIVNPNRLAHRKFPSFKYVFLLLLLYRVAQKKSCRMKHELRKFQNNIQISRFWPQNQ